MALALLPRQMVVDINGIPRVAARRYFYLAGTTTPITTYTTAAYGPTNANPVVSVSDGFFPAVHINPAVNATYKEVVKDSADVTIWTEDNIATPLNSEADILAALSGADIGGIIYPQSAVELAASITPSSYIYPYGHPNRSTSFYEDIGWVDYGDVPTYINSTSFSVPGNQTSRYTPYTRVLGIGTASRADVRVVSSAFTTVTTVTITTNDVGGSLPNPMIAVWVSRNLSAHGPGHIRINSNTITGLEVVNANNGTTTAARFCARTLDASGVANSAICMVAVGPNYSTAYLTGGFATGSGRGVIYTPPSYSLEIGTSDVARILIPSGSTAINFSSDITVVNSTGATRSKISCNGPTDAMIDVLVASVQKGYLYASATEVIMGSVAAIDVSILYNGARVLSFSGANATGASTPTLGTNKPGSGSSPATWLTCKDGAGNTRYIPMWS